MPPYILAYELELFEAYFYDLSNSIMF